MVKHQIVLASASPRRRDLLRQHGFTVKIEPADVEELLPEHLTVGESTLFNAKRKAAAVAASHPDSLVLAADTLVAIEGKILGKPRDLDEAFEMLTALSGRTHEVFSGVWLTHSAKAKIRGFVEVSRVHFKKLKPSKIRDYMALIGPLDKAGAYAAQDYATEVIESIEGSFTNVVGLPMEALLPVLASFI